MLRNIIRIDESRCDGCGLCAKACEEGALAIIDGKAKLIKEDHCDGLGNCLPACPQDAIAIIKKEAAPFKMEAPASRRRHGAKSLHHHKATPQPQHKEVKSDQGDTLACGCSKHTIRSLKPRQEESCPHQDHGHQPGALCQWPVQIKLLPITAPFYQGAELLIAADCTAYAYADFHRDFIKGHVTLVGCPKLDDTDYSEKLTEILKNNDIGDITLTRMSVPCCGGMEKAVKTAIQAAGKKRKLTVYTISAEGDIIEEKSER